MRVVVALGGNALLKRGEPMTADVQRANVKVAAQALAPVSRDHQLIVTHGTGRRSGSGTASTGVFGVRERISARCAWR